MSNTLYPLFLKLTGRPVLVVGGGAVASRRVPGLLESGARVTVVSPDLSVELRCLHDAGKLSWHRRKFQPEDLAGAHLVYLASGDPEVLDALDKLRSLPGGRFLLNVAEDESRSDFHLPAVAARGPLKLAVSTGGSSPAAAGAIRDRLESWLERNRDLVEGLLSTGRTAAAAAGGEKGPGEAEKRKVYLVGAGPGDPGLLTLRALRLLESADVVYYDRLVSAGILETIPAGVEKVYVGKEVGCSRYADSDALMIRSAREGKAVVRLKGGDPMVFGRGGEEMLALREAGVEFEVVPGVSALSSVPGVAGIPVTLRGLASEIVVRSGHDAHGLKQEEKGAPSRTTFVYFMGARRLPEIVAELRSDGLPASTPVAVIQKGTLPEQRVLVSDLEHLAEQAAREGVETPALVVVGEVVKCHDPSANPGFLLQPEVSGFQSSHE